MTDRVLVQVRLPAELVKRIDHKAVDAGVYRNEMMEKLLTLGLEALERQGDLLSSRT